jgi:asparagine synthase (glutamine-hydrolysing)
MSPGYLLVVGERHKDRDALIRQIARRSGLVQAFTNHRIVALAGPSCPCLAVGDAGCVLGTLFERGGPARALSALHPEQAAVIAASEGRSLLASHWGGYVAAIACGESSTIIRDPSADFPCYYVEAERFTIFASDAELLVKSGVIGVSVDCEEIGRQLFRAFVPMPTTALRGIHELLAGFALRIASGGVNRKQCWDPWDHVEGRDEDRASAGQALARTIQHSVHAIASVHGRVLVSVSGGLDSSIVASCLARAGADAVCLTMFTDDPAGDERVFARALCERSGLKLIERPYRLADIDLDEAMAPNLPRPKDRMQALAFERVNHAVAAEIGADAFVTGNGGDHVFGYSQSAAPIADRYLAEGLSRGTLASLIDVCRQTGCSMGDALRQAWGLAHSSRSYRVRPNPLFLHPDFVASLGPNDWHHAWLDAPSDALPGKAAHVATILRVQPNLEPSLGAAYPVLNPLVSQPVVETCLGIPSWAWREGGRDRALVRRAFADTLPPAVLNRRVKGTPGRFAAQLLDHFRSLIRDRLLGGRLAANGIIDADALDELLAGERPVPDLERVRTLELANAEAWIGHWRSRSKAFEPLSPDIRSGDRGRLPASGDPIP